MHPNDRRVPRAASSSPASGEPGGARLAVIDRVEIGCRRAWSTDRMR